MHHFLLVAGPSMLLTCAVALDSVSDSRFAELTTASEVRHAQDAEPQTDARRALNSLQPLGGRDRSLFL